jgi:hypothetical protein
MRSPVQIYPSSIKGVVGLLMMIPVSTGLSLARAIAEARRA